MKSENNDPHAPPTAEFTHIPSLDGVRGIAVLAVIIFHAGHVVPALAAVTKSGHLGVQIFFLLSGFLITSLLLKEHAVTGTINLKNFYVRRTLRLVPAYWAFLLFVYFVGSSFQSADESARLHGDWHFISAFFYVSNWQNIAVHPEAPSALIHLWSLAIEEQFYIGFSLLMWLLMKMKATRAQMFATLAVIVVLAVAARAVRVASGTPPWQLYFSLDTRIDGLLMGGLAGMVYMWKMLPAAFYASRAFQILAALSALTLLVIGVYFPNNVGFYYAGMPVFSLATATLILFLTTSPKSYSSRLLEFAPLQYVGRISYGLYLWNVIGYIIASNIFVSPVGIILFGVVVSFGFAIVSHNKIEQPFLKLKSKFT